MLTVKSLKGSSWRPVKFHLFFAATRPLSRSPAMQHDISTVNLESLRNQLASLLVLAQDELYQSVGESAAGVDDP